MRLWMLLVLPGCLVGMDPGGQEGGSGTPEADADTDADTDADSDADTDADPSLSGLEVFRYRSDKGDVVGAAAPLSCELTFQLVGTAASTAECEGCEFAFDVDYTLIDEKSVDDGTCAGLGYFDGFGGTYAYHPDFEGYGPSWLLSYYGTWTYSASAVLKEDSFTYRYTVGSDDAYYFYDRIGSTFIE